MFINFVYFSFGYLLFCKIISLFGTVYLFEIAIFIFLFIYLLADKFIKTIIYFAII